MLDNPPGVEIIRGDALQYLSSTKSKFDLIFLDPPFNKDWIPRLEPFLAGVANEDLGAELDKLSDSDKKHVQEGLKLLQSLGDLF